jgi:hypothetical protein
MCAVILCLNLLNCLPIADRISIEGMQPNPGGDPQLLIANGRFTLVPHQRVMEIRLKVASDSNPGQTSWVFAKYNDRGEWQGKLRLPAGEYECWVELVTTDAAGDPKSAKSGILTQTDRTTIRIK